MQELGVLRGAAAPPKTRLLHVPNLQVDQNYYKFVESRAYQTYKVACYSTTHIIERLFKGVWWIDLPHHGLAVVDCGWCGCCDLRYVGVQVCHLLKCKLLSTCYKLLLLTIRYMSYWPLKWIHKLLQCDVIAQTNPSAPLTVTYYQHSLAKMDHHYVSNKIRS